MPVTHRKRRRKRRRQPIPPPAAAFRTDRRIRPGLPEPDGDWWAQAFNLKLSPSEAGGHRCGQHQMLILIGYDITNPKRLQRVAKVCEDWGIRVQYSMFECRLEATEFTRFWEELQSKIDDSEDRLVAYPICLRCAREIRCAGTMVTSEKYVAYVC